MKKNRIIIPIVIGILCMLLVMLISVQVRTIDQTDITALESMKDEEIRNEIVELKKKNEDLNSKIEENENKIKEYQETVNNSQKATEVLNNELAAYESKIGLTDVTGSGVILTLTDSDLESYSYSNLVDFVNELKYAGATAISINDNRIINTTEIVEISKKYILLNGDQRVTSPYVIKAIGDKEKMLQTLKLKDEGYLDLYKNAGYDIKLEASDNITIYKYSKEINVNYIKKGEE